MSQERGFKLPRYWHWSALACAIVLLPLCGCNTFGNGKLVQELQNENSRLLTEYRAERDRREKADQALQTARSRLAESEKLLAMQGPMEPMGRLSRLPPPAPTTSAASPQSSFSSELQGFGSAAKPNSSEDQGLKWQRRLTP